MDAEMQRLVDERIVAAVKAATDPLIAQITELKGSVGQVAEAGTKISEIQKNLKIVSDTVAAQKILGADDVKGLISAEMTASQKAAQEKAAAEATAAEAQKAIKAEKDSFIAEKLKGIPAAYHSLLGDAKEKWGEMEKTIRDTFAADAKAAGLQVPNVGGSGGGSSVQSTGAATDGGFLVMPGAPKA